MIEIIATVRPDKLTLLACGHATGRPEVCAGVSALLYALKGWADNCTERELWPAGDWETRVGKGSAYFRLPRTEGAEPAFGLVFHGLLQIYATAPDAVSVSYGE